MTEPGGQVPVRRSQLVASNSLLSLPIAATITADPKANDTTIENIELEDLSNNNKN